MKQKSDSSNSNLQDQHERTLHSLSILYPSSNFSQELIIVSRNKDYFYHVSCLAFIQFSISRLQILVLQIFIYI